MRWDSVSVSALGQRRREKRLRDEVWRAQPSSACSVCLFVLMMWSTARPMRLLKRVRSVEAWRAVSTKPWNSKTSSCLEGRLE